VLVSLLLALTLIVILVGAILWILNSSVILQGIAEIAMQEARHSNRISRRPIARRSGWGRSFGR
jgi:hypothetical protein